MQPHEQLEQFFGEFFRLMHQAEPSTYNAFMKRAESEFKRLGYREQIPIGVENILIVRLDVIGDMVLTSGFIRELRKNFPNANITLIVSPLVYPIVELCPYVNEVLTFDIKKLGENFPSALEKIATFCKEHLWRKHFSIAFSPQWGSDNLPGLLMCWLSGARERVGYGEFPAESWGLKPPAFVEERDKFLLTKIIITPRSVVAEVEKHLYLLEAVGLKVNQNHMELFFDAADIFKALELLKGIPSNCKKVLLGLGAGDLRFLRPDHQLEECAKLPPVHGWCHAKEPHCITQIKPQEIIEGFKILEEL